MPSLAIHTGRAVTPLAEIPDGLILVEDGRIRAIGPRSGMALPPDAQEYDARGLTAAPGFLDVHIHGAAGHDAMEATPQALAAIAACAGRHGTTSYLATTASSGVPETLRS